MFQKGSLVAFALAGVFAASGCSRPEEAAPKKEGAASGAAMQANVKCTGVNECAGHGGCKSAANECKGKNGCKGKGFVEMSADDCNTKGGKVM
jgi:hypothetical protein